jgi:hypothetical protein
MPTPAGALISAARRDLAKAAVDLLVAHDFQDRQFSAVASIDSLLDHRGGHYLNAIIGGFTYDHVAESEQDFRHLQVCLMLDGAFVPIAVEALDALLHRECDDHCTHEAFFEAAGLIDVWRSCMRCVHDVISASMLRDPGTLEHVMQMTTVHLVTKSKLQQSYNIVRAHFRAVGQHLTAIG